MKLASSLAALALATAVVSFSDNAHALPIGVELGAQAGVGSNPTNSTINPLGFGIGARGGVSILGIYGGARVMYYLGGSEGPFSAHTLLYGVEGGFSIRLLDDLLTIRPQLGVGNSTWTLTGSAGGKSADTSNSYLYLEPGVVAYVALGSFFVGADLNLLVIPGVDEVNLSTLQTESKTYTAVTMHGQVGLKF